MHTTEALPAGRAGLVPGPAQVEIVIPVLNEERDLGPSVRRLREYLAGNFPFAAVVTIADNGSTDGTWARALDLADEFAAVRAVRIERPGRGGRCTRSGRKARPTSTRTWTWTCPPT
jgi:hypothetical protein